MSVYKFSYNSSGSYNVSGAGKNLYGNYTCTGLLTDIIGNTGTLEMFRVYDQAAPPPPPANEAATASTAAPAARRQSRPPVTQTDLSVSGSAAISPAHKKQGTGMGMGMMGAKLESKRKVGQGMMPKTSPVAKPKVGTGMGGGGGMQPLPKVIPDKHVTRARQVVKQLREQVGVSATRAKWALGGRRVDDTRVLDGGRVDSGRLPCMSADVSQSRSLHLGYGPNLLRIAEADKLLCMLSCVRHRLPPCRGSRSLSTKPLHPGTRTSSLR